MKSKIIISMALLLASLSLSQAQTPVTIVQWTFENDPIQAPETNPAPNVNNSFGKEVAASLGMNIYATPSVGTNDPDVLQGKKSDAGANSITNVSNQWRIRGQNAAGTANGWSSLAPVGTQGAQFSVDTTGYTNIQVGFDWYITTQGEANMQVQYTTDGSTWINIPVAIPPSPPAPAATNDAGVILVTNIGSPTPPDPNSVNGYYLCDNMNSNVFGGQEWFTNLTATITNPLAANDPNFGIRLVNASTGSSCLCTVGTNLNNNSGNWRFDNVIIQGVFAGLTPPILTNSSTATVDGPFTNTFAVNSSWQSDITSIKVNGTVLPIAAYTVSAGQIVFMPSASPLLQTAGTVTIVVNASSYSPDQVSQYIGPGAAKTLAVTTQPEAPTGNGGTFVAQPTLMFFDQYSNVATNASAVYTATPSAGWSFGPGSGISVLLTDGAVTFTNLSATNATFISGATITFTASGTSGLNGLSNPNTNSAAFNLPAPPATGFTTGHLAVEQVDLASANSTFSILELNPAVSNSAPLNIFPVPATATNGLRQSSAASTGSLADSDDGTLLCFSASQCSDSTVSDITSLNPRGAGTFNSQGNYVLQATYLGGGALGNQARSAVTVDDVTFFIGDKGGVYTNSETTNDAYILYSQNNPANVRSLKSFGGTVFALQQEGSTDPNATVIATVPPNGSGGGALFPFEGFPSDGTVLDFYALRSGNNGANYDTIYYIDGTNASSGSIFKYYFTGGYDGNTEQPIWASAGSWFTTNGGAGLCAVTNVNGGVDLYYTTGKGNTVGNSVVHVHDSAAWNLPINLTATNILYTVSTNSILKGIAFAPLPVVGNLNTLTYTGGGFSLSFNSPAVNVTSASFTVWSTTNIALPFSQWKNLGHPTGPAGPSGITYSFTDTAATDNPATFYRVTNP